MANKKIGIILPTLNEEESIGKLIDEIKKIPNSNEWNIYVVDSKSKDSTVKIAKEKGAKIIHVEEKGKAIAIKKAFELIEEDYIIMLDSDLSYSPKHIPEIIEKLKEYDVVMGSRFKGKIEENAMKSINKVGNIIFTALASLLYKKTTDVCTGMWGFRKEAYKNINIDTKGFDLEVNLFIESVKKGFKISEIPIVYRKRGGYSKLNIADGVPILTYLIKRKIKG